MNSFILSIGSNSHDREWQMTHTLNWLKKHFSDITVSSTYEAAEVTGRFAPYQNCVMKAATSMTFDEVTAFTKQWESVCGRTPNSKLIGSVPIDLDVVIWNGQVVRPHEFEQDYFRQGYLQLKGSSL
jgi:2-amino-4-hydroxy-6-hydroxymethyldihydropteridine diphosphokinase